MDNLMRQPTLTHHSEKHEAIVVLFFIIIFSIIVVFVVTFETPIPKHLYCCRKTSRLYGFFLIIFLTKNTAGVQEFKSNHRNAVLINGIGRSKCPWVRTYKLSKSQSMSTEIQQEKLDVQLIILLRISIIMYLGMLCSHPMLRKHEAQ